MFDEISLHHDSFNNCNYTEPLLNVYFQLFCPTIGENSLFLGEVIDVNCNIESIDIPLHIYFHKSSVRFLMALDPGSCNIVCNNPAWVPGFKKIGPLLTLAEHKSHMNTIQQNICIRIDEDH